MADLELGVGDGFHRDLGGQDGALTFAEAFTSYSLLLFSIPIPFYFNSHLVLSWFEFNTS